MRHRTSNGYAVTMTCTAEAYVPRTRDLGELAEAARSCRGCDLYRDADQTVFGEGAARAPMMLVGEQPGDQEDRQGRPFVGPAGKLLDEALAAADIDRGRLYVTNAVKHFKFTRTSGTRRIHKTPSRTEVVACRPWLFAEITSVEPQVVVLLGATAAQALLGSGFRLTAHRGEELRLPTDPDLGVDPSVVTTTHPSAILRGPAEQRATKFDALVADLQFAAGLVSG